VETISDLILSSAFFTRVSKMAKAHKLAAILRDAAPIGAAPQDEVNNAISAS
jgi:hypothetical protein